MREEQIVAKNGVHVMECQLAVTDATLVAHQHDLDREDPFKTGRVLLRLVNVEGMNVDKAETDHEGAHAPGVVIDDGQHETEGHRAVAARHLSKECLHFHVREKDIPGGQRPGRTACP